MFKYELNGFGGEIGGVRGKQRLYVVRLSPSPPFVPIRTFVLIIQERKGFDFGMGDIISFKVLFVSLKQRMLLLNRKRQNREML